MLTLTDLFCGAGGSSTGAVSVPGVEVRLAANHWDKAIETHNYNHPDADHLQADISVVDPRYVPKTDLLWASPECFTAGHLVTTDQGQKPIEKIEIGDRVLTHKGRFMPVTRTQSRQQSTVTVKGQGHIGIETTGNHKFWARPSALVWNNSLRQYRRQYWAAEWVPASDLSKRSALWATPHSVEPLEVPELPGIFGGDWFLVGRWVGDGSLGLRDGEVAISVGYHQADELQAQLAKTGHRWVKYAKRTAAVFTVWDHDAAKWLTKHFGRGAAGKQIPTWALSLPVTSRRELLSGYVYADGHTTARSVHISTVSRALAVSARLLAESLGHRVSMGQNKRTTYKIEGRTGKALRQYVLRWENELSDKRSPEAFIDGIHAWSRVRSVSPTGREETVYNIEVEGDHSYVIDGIVVKNCTNHSRAKGKKAITQPDLFGDTLADEAAERSRATMWDVVRFTEVHQYKLIFVENVVEVTNWLPFQAWLQAMHSLGYKHRIVSLNSMHAHAYGLPAPQSRDRVYICFWQEKNRAPDFDRMLRPRAWCPTCEMEVRAIQAWKPNRKIGRYRQQYNYRCPSVKRRNQIVEPYWLPASTVIDWSLPGTRIGDREKPLSPNTMRRIQAGIDRYWGAPMSVEMVNGYDAADPKHPQHGDPSAYYRVWAATDPLRTLNTAESKGWAWGPLAVPVEGREGKQAKPMADPLRTATTRNETAVAFPPLIQSYYGNNQGAKPVTEALDTVTTNERHALLQGQTPLIDDVYFRMLEPDEYKLAMAFPGEYRIVGNRREQVKMAGNAVTPPSSRDLIATGVGSL